MYKKIIAKSALNKNDNYFTPYRYDLNVYRGCEHNCSYCYAMYSHKYLDDDKNFFNNVYFKENIAEILDKELSKRTWKRDLIGFGTVCDSYQQVEKELKLSRQCLKVLLKHKASFYMSTKSPLILRDLDLLSKLSEVAPISIAFSIITTDDKLGKKLEPNAPLISERINAVKKLKEETKALVGIHLMPVIPYITDNKENLENIVKMASELNLDFIIVDMLNLYGETKKSFFKFIEDVFPEKANSIKEIYKSSKNISEYNENLHRLIKSIKNKYHFHNKTIKNVLNDNQIKQLSIFDADNK